MGIFAKHRRSKFVSITLSVLVLSGAEAVAQNSEDFDLKWTKDSVIRRTVKKPENNFVTVFFQSGADQSDQEITPALDVPFLKKVDTEIAVDANNKCSPVIKMYHGALPKEATTAKVKGANPCKDQTCPGFFGTPTIFTCRGQGNLSVSQTIDFFEVRFLDRADKEKKLECVTFKKIRKDYDRFPVIDAHEPVPQGEEGLVQVLAGGTALVYIDSPNANGVQSGGTIATTTWVANENVRRTLKLSTYIRGDCGTKNVYYWKFTWQTVIDLEVKAAAKDTLGKITLAQEAEVATVSLPSILEVQGLNVLTPKALFPAHPESPNDDFELMKCEKLEKELKK